MNPDIKESWVAALRSGKYEQTRGYLHVVESVSDKNPEGFCCLGVLCDLVEQEIRFPVTVQLEGSTGFEIELFDGVGSCLPASVKYHTGLSYDDAATLASMNDKGASFVEIAYFIERNV